MSKFVQTLYNETVNLINNLEVYNEEGAALDFFESIYSTAEIILKNSSVGNKILFIGNGGSAAIASHMAADCFNNGNIKALAFNDAPAVTCISNDYGYEYVFEKPLEMYTENGDMLFAISSSGQSENILRGVNAYQKKNAEIFTFSGFKDDNPLKGLGIFNFYVASSNYCYVETIHHLIIHSILNTFIHIKAEAEKGQ